MDKWDERFLKMAALVASWSKDPSTQAGAVLVDTNNRVLGAGFNGLPRGVKDDSELLADRETKYKVIIHAEENALLFSTRSTTRGITAYVYPLPPCARCASKLIQAGVSRVVSVHPTQDILDRWSDDLKLAENLYTQAGVLLQLYDNPLER